MTEGLIRAEIEQIVLRLLKAQVPIEDVDRAFWPVKGIAGNDRPIDRLERLTWLAELFGVSE